MRVLFLGGMGAGAALTDPEATVMALGAESREGSSGPSQGAGGEVAGSRTCVASTSEATCPTVHMSNWSN